MEPLVGQIVSRGHLSPLQSMIFVDGVATLGLLFVAAVALRESLRQGRVASRLGASLVPNAALVEGEGVVMGTIELDEGTKAPVRVEVEQEGTESESSGVWSHQWIETCRRVSVRPFLLRHASGARIRVDPRANAMFINALKGLIRVDHARRVRVTELLPGEKVFVYGELSRAPDSGADGFTLVPPGGGRMLLASEPIAKAFAQRAAFHRRWAVVAVAAAVAFNAFFASFHARRWLGEAVDVRIAELRSYDGADDEEHFRVTMKAADQTVFSDEVSRSDFQRLHEGDRLQVRHVPLWRSAAAIGSRATAHSRAYFGVPLLGFLVLAYGMRVRATRPWYEQKKLIDKGNGKLSESRPTVRSARNSAAEIL